MGIWPFGGDDSKEPRIGTTRQKNEHGNLINWSQYTDPRILGPAILLSAAFIGSWTFYQTYLRRLKGATSITPRFWRKRSLFGTVTRVGDGDNFHLYHTPGGRLAGWGWLPHRKVPVKGKDLKENTVHIRIAGIDAPEMAHFGRPEQPYGKEALEWLTSYLLHQRVRVYIFRKDQYDRAVGTVYIRKFLFRKDVGLQMLKRGLATVYEAKTGVEFGGLEKKYRWAESFAKMTKKGMWAGRRAALETPREYKSRMSELEKR